MSFDPHQFGRNAAVDIFSGVTSAVLSARASAQAQADADATEGVMAEWEEQADVHERVIRQLLGERDQNRATIREQSEELAVLRAELASALLSQADMPHQPGGE